VLSVKREKKKRSLKEKENEQGFSLLDFSERTEWKGILAFSRIHTFIPHSTRNRIIIRGTLEETDSHHFGSELREKTEVTLTLQVQWNLAPNTQFSIEEALMIKVLSFCWQ
jgi:hypothetical protein